MEIKATLTKRVGPLPVWGWGAVGVGAVGLFLIFRSRGKTGAGATQETGIGFGDVGGGGGGGGGGSPAPPEGPKAPSSGGGSQQPPASGGSSGGGTTPGQQAKVDAAKEFWLNKAGIQSADSRQSLTLEASQRGLLNPSAQATVNALSNTIANVSRIVDQSSTGMISVQTGYRETNQAVAQALTQRGYTAGYYNGTTYAARDNQSFIRGLPTDAGRNLARLLVSLAGQQRAA